MGFLDQGRAWGGLACHLTVGGSEGGVGKTVRRGRRDLRKDKGAGRSNGRSVEGRGGGFDECLYRRYYSGREKWRKNGKRSVRGRGDGK